MKKYTIRDECGTEPGPWSPREVLGVIGVLTPPHLFSAMIVLRSLVELDLYSPNPSNTIRIWPNGTLFSHYPRSLTVPPIRCLIRQT